MRDSDWAEAAASTRSAPARNYRVAETYTPRPGRRVLPTPSMLPARFLLNSRKVIQIRLLKAF